MILHPATLPLLRQVVPISALSRHQRHQEPRIVRIILVQVYRMELDVTGDGKPELFPGTTWEAGRRGLLWVVYSPQPDGTYRPLGVIQFAYTSFYYSASSSTIFVPVSDGPGAGPAFVYYHVGADGISDITKTYASDPGADLASMSAWQAKGRPSAYVDSLRICKVLELLNGKTLIRTQSIHPLASSTGRSRKPAIGPPKSIWTRSAMPSACPRPSN
jgi:hypothetical protein